MAVAVAVEPLGVAAAPFALLASFPSRSLPPLLAVLLLALGLLCLLPELPFVVVSAVVVLDAVSVGEGTLMMAR